MGFSVGSWGILGLHERKRPWKGFACGPGPGHCSLGETWAKPSGKPMQWGPVAVTKAMIDLFSTEFTGFSSDTHPGVALIRS